MSADAAPAQNAGAAFVFRSPCPSCEFTIGVRREDIDTGTVRCPVCSASSTITSEPPPPDSPFRENASPIVSTALVPVEPPAPRAKPERRPRWEQIRSRTISPRERLYRVTRTNPYRRLLPLMWIMSCLIAMLMVSDAVPALAIAAVALGVFALSTYQMGARWVESATLEGVELTLRSETPFAIERVLRIHGARIDVERRGKDEGVVVLACHGETLMLGETAPLSIIAAETLAERLRKVRAAP